MKKISSNTIITVNTPIYKPIYQFGIYSAKSNKDTNNTKSNDKNYAKKLIILKEAIFCILNCFKFHPAV